MVVTQQLNEMSQMQGTLFELERTHTKIKTQYARNPILSGLSIVTR